MVSKKRRLPQPLVIARECFVCQKVLGRDAEKEHVVPRWLQRELRLWDAEYEASGGTKGYRLDRLQVPVCHACNRRLGKVLEEPMRDVVLNGAAINPDIACVWLAKIALGFAVYNASYATQRRWAGEPVVVEPEFLDDAFNLHRLVLQEIGKGELTFEPRRWSTLFVYETQTSGDYPKGNYDFMEDPSARMVSLRAGRLGFVVFLFDSGAVGSGEDTHFKNAFVSQPLSPFQFRELAAVAASIGEQRIRGLPVDARVRRQPGATTIALSSELLKSLASGPLDLRQVAERIAAYCFMDVDDFLGANGGLATSLCRPDGGPIQLGFREAFSLNLGKRYGKPVLAPAHWTSGRRRRVGQTAEG